MAIRISVRGIVHIPMRRAHVDMRSRMRSDAHPNAPRGAVGHADRLCASGRAGAGGAAGGGGGWGRRGARALRLSPRAPVHACGRACAAAQAAARAAGDQALLTARIMREVAAARAGVDAGDAGPARAPLSYDVYVAPGPRGGGGGGGGGLGAMEARVFALERAVGVRGGGADGDAGGGAGADAVGIALAGRTLSQAVADVRAGGEGGGGARGRQMAALHCDRGARRRRRACGFWTRRRSRRSRGSARP